MSDVKRLKERLPAYIRNIKQAKKEEQIVSHYRDLITGIFPKIGQGRLIDFTGVSIRVYGEDGQASTMEADLLWDDILIEFESSLSKTKIAESERQLRQYVSGCLNKDRDKVYRLFSSDGITFCRYDYGFPADKKIITPDDISLKPAGRLSLKSRTWNKDRLDYEELLRMIVEYLTPCRLDLVPIEDAHRLFVPDSILYEKCLRILERQNDSDYNVQFAEWCKYQNLVYGDFIRPDDKAGKDHRRMFLNHTYMATIAKVIAYAMIYPDGPITTDKKESILVGDAFKSARIYNFITEDFFSWIINSKDALEVMDLIFDELKRFNARDIDRDILRSIYETIEEPEKRHVLGAVYTPGWLAEMILDELLGQYKSDKIPAILDPACGSGTFLALAIRKIQKKFKSDSDRELLESIVGSVVGFDLHPVAVLFSKTNYLIALKNLLGGPRDAVSIPVYMADTIDFPEPKSTSEQLNTACYSDASIYVYTVDGDHDLVLPKDVIESGQLDVIIDIIQRYAKKISADRSRIDIHLQGLKSSLAEYKISSDYQLIIRDTAKTLACLIEQKKDTIHAFIFKNIYKPAIVSDFDIIAGNPPWVVYKNMADKGRQDRLRGWVDGYKLIPGQKNFQAMEMATLFFARCADRFLKKGGVIGFVMPRSILQGDQHDKFRFWERNDKVPFRYTLLYDMGDPMRVRNLFTVESCVLFGKKKNSRHDDKIPSYQFGGRPNKDATLNEVESLIEMLKFYKKKAVMYIHKGRPGLSTITTVKDLFLKESVYMEQFAQGATIVPQVFWIVQESSDSMGASSDRPLLETAARANAKKPWKGITIKGAVPRKYLFSTISGGAIIPFDFTDSTLIVAPVAMQNRSPKMLSIDDLESLGDDDMAEWVRTAQRHWLVNKMDRSPDTVQERLNYHDTLTDQDMSKDMILLYNTGGREYLAACLLYVSELRQKEGTSGFIADSSTYYYYPESVDEGKYLCAVINSRYLFDCIRTIKSSRAIHRKPWEFPVPKFKPGDVDHKRLVRLYEECHSKIKNREELDIDRDDALRVIVDEMRIIDELTKKIIIENYQKGGSVVQGS